MKWASGGWPGKSTTGLGMETWKALLYILWEAQVCRPVIPGCPVLVPYCDLCVQTWHRYHNGDTPGYEKLRTTAYR